MSLKELQIMKFGCPLIAVKDIHRSRDFYENVLRQRVSLDLGANVSFGDGFAIQSDYKRLVGTGDFNISYKGNDHELYFEEENFDEFEKHLQQFSGIIYVHRAKEYPWGQRVIRFYDPDFHIIEVGESMESVFRKFYKQGMSIVEVAARTSHPAEFVKKYLL
jgi:catechol 2,3-dioxygenase-like lactoylglutathione lyase family enzyme